MLKILGYDVEIDGHQIYIEPKCSFEEMMTITSYLVDEGYLDMQIWCQENGIF